MHYLLVDNGSLRAESVLNLRRIARELGQSTGMDIIPASLLHSSKVDPAELENEPAVNLERRLRWLLEQGEREFTLMPFFIGPSGAILDYLPQRLARLRERFGDFSVRRTDFLFADGDERLPVNLVSILADRVRSTISSSKLVRPKVVLVDHGSPQRAVTGVRDTLADLLAETVAAEVEEVLPASMERREGEAYAYNEPLLEKLLRQPQWSKGPLVIAMLFLSPGRHAGIGGDVHQICREAKADNPLFEPFMTGLAGTHPLIVPLLRQRLQSCLTEI
jgi:sirohydrochlorin ferrochelatase